MNLNIYNYKMLAKEQVREYKREYYKKNKDKIIAHRKENWTYSNHKYRMEHPEMVRIANKKYYEKNKEILLAKAREKYANKKYKKGIEYIYKI